VDLEIRPIEDAQRDWAALGQEKLQIVPLSRFKQGTPISLAEGILFTTYATLRSDVRQGRDGALKASRLAQIIDWLGTDFDSVIVFDASATRVSAGKRHPRNRAARDCGSKTPYPMPVSSNPPLVRPSRATSSASAHGAASAFQECE
jgi:hypothetical protein